MVVFLGEMLAPLRVQLRHMLQREPWVTSVGSSEAESYSYGESGFEAWLSSLAHSQAAPSLAEEVLASHADIVLLDWSMAEPLPAGAIDIVHACAPHTAIVGIGVRPEARRRAFAAGLDMTLSDCDDATAILTALRVMYAPSYR